MAASESPDGCFIATETATGGLQIRAVASGETITELPGHGAAVSALAFDARGTSLASAAASGVILYWRLGP